MPSRCWIARALMIATCCCSAARATDYTLYPHWIESHLDAQELEITSVSAIEVFGQPYVLATTPTRGLLFFTPTATGLVPVSDVALPGSEVGTAVDGWYAYVAGDGPSARLSKLSIVDPTSPSIAWQVDLPAEPRSVRLHADLALLPCGADGLLVFDRTEVAGHPVGVVAQWPEHAVAVASVDGVAYLLSHDGLHVLDLADPTEPAELGFLSLPLSSAADLVEHQGQLVVGAGNGVWLLGLSDPLAPTIAAVANDLSGIRSLSSGNGTLYALAQNEIASLAPDLAVSWQSPLRMDQCRCLMAGHGLVAIGTAQRGLHVLAEGLHAAPPASPGVVVQGYNPVLRQVVGDRAYVTMGRGTRSYRLDLDAPVLEWTHFAPNTDEYVEALDVRDGRAYIGYSTGRIEVVDVSGPQPVSLFHWMLHQDADIFDLAWNGAVLAVVWDPDGPFEPIVHQLSTHDLSVHEPVLLDQVAVDYHWSVYATGDALAVWSNTSAGDRLDVYDASDPTDLRLATSVPKPIYSDLTGSGPYLHVSSETTLQILRVNTPDEVDAGPVLPVPVWNSWHRFHRVGDVGYLSSAELVYDLSDPLVPRPVGSFATPTVPFYTEMSASADHLVRMTSNQIYAMPAQDAVTTAAPDGGATPAPAAASLRAAPNPFNPRVTLSFAMPRPGEARLEIFDARGRRVAARTWTVERAGETSLSWDGRDDDRRALPSGIYLARISGAGLRATAKVTLAR